jgi:diaminopimelate epimerase
MKRLSFWKMSGSGNDFILVDNRRGAVAAGAGPDLARRLCERRFSVGADGLILVEDSQVADFAWKFYNADGSEAAMCGNGGRCAARFAFLMGMVGEKMAFETGAGIIRAEVRGESVKLQLPPPHGFRSGVRLRAADGAVTAGHITVGVPHAVIAVDDIEKAPVHRLGRIVRNHGEFAPEGTNVNFFQVTGPRRIAVRTYERGVEAETMACGTGSVATAMTAGAAGLVKSPVVMVTRGGEELKVYFRRRGTAFTNVYLEGEANVVYEGRTSGETAAPAKGKKGRT